MPPISIENDDVESFRQLGTVTTPPHTSNDGEQLSVFKIHIKSGAQLQRNRVNPETGKQARKATSSFYTPREIANGTALDRRGLLSWWPLLAIFSTNN